MAQGVYICSETCAKCVRKEYLSCICVQMLRISRYLPVRRVRGAELVLFAVPFWSFPGFTSSLLVMGADSANFA